MLFENFILRGVVLWPHYGTISSSYQNTGPCRRQFVSLVFLRFWTALSRFLKLEKLEIGIRAGFRWQEKKSFVQKNISKGRRYAYFNIVFCKNICKVLEKKKTILQSARSCSILSSFMEFLPWGGVHTRLFDFINIYLPVFTPPPFFVIISPFLAMK